MRRHLPQEFLHIDGGVEAIDRFVSHRVQAGTDAGYTQGSNRRVFSNVVPTMALSPGSSSGAPIPIPKAKVPVEAAAAPKPKANGANGDVEWGRGSTAS